MDSDIGEKINDDNEVLKALQWAHDYLKAGNYAVAREAVLEQVVIGMHALQFLGNHLPRYALRCDGMERDDRGAWVPFTAIKRIATE